MECPNCGQLFENGGTCPKCRLDTVLYSGTVKISDILYNRGLHRAQINDLSGAADCLKKSVETNRHNLQARNLLGLVLYETGRVGEALKHWVVSSSMVKEDNPAAGYLEDARRSGSALERMNDAVKMYNQALEYIRLKSDDMAIIQLKKAVENSPKFIDAMNLLTLCYLIQRDKDKASFYVERVLALDAHNTVALNYYNELNPGRSLPPRARKPAAATAPESKSAFRPVTVREKKSNSFHIAEILSFIIGAACMFMAFYALVMPAVRRDSDTRITEYQQQLNAKELEYRESLDEKTAEINENASRIRELEADMTGWDIRFDEQERSIIILKAHSMLLQNRFQEAVDNIMYVETAGLPSDIQDIAADIKNTAYPVLSQTYYDDGVQAYSQDRDYDKAMVDFEKAHRYTPDDAEIMPDLLYYLGFTYTMHEDKIDKAVEILTTLVNNYPDYRRISEVTQKLDDIR